jgi:putative SOS response-associated peptidase YedK
MCGRYGLKSDKQDIADAFYAKRVNPKVVLAPNYNVAPSTFLPVVRLDDEGDRELTLMQRNRSARCGTDRGDQFSYRASGRVPEPDPLWGGQIRDRRHQ